MLSVKNILYACLAVIILLTGGLWLQHVQGTDHAQQLHASPLLTHYQMMQYDAERSRRMQEKLQEIMAEEKNLEGALIGMSVRSRETGDILYEHNGNIRMNPASNMKLLTSAAALSVLGEDYRLTTELWKDGEVQEGTLAGDVILKGKGDPTLLPEDFSTFANELKEKGITEIDGDLIGDDQHFDDERLPVDLTWSDESYYYGAQVSALTAAPDHDYDTGSLIVEVKPEAPVGESPEVSVYPETDYITVTNEAKIVAAGGAHDIEVTREHGSNDILIEGTIPTLSWNAREYIAVWNPTGYALELFEHALEEEGISITGSARQQKTPETAERLYTHESIRLADLLVPFMKLSNNGHAEMLVKEMGQVVHGEGSWEKGIEVMEDELQAFDMNTDTLVIRDGSGISQSDLLPANEITKLLYNVREEEWYDVFHTSLPTAGKEKRMIGGTLQSRMENVQAHAKTGTINGVSTLSGYVHTDAGNELIFSILLNNLLDDEDGPPIEDRLVEALQDF